VRERGLHQLEPERKRGAAIDRVERARIVRRLHDDHGVAEILGGGAHQRRPADVDLLDQIVERRRGIGRRSHEGVQIDDHQVDEADALARERRQIVRMIAAREDAAVDRRVQRLDPAVHHLREASHVGDGDYRQAGVAQRARGAPGRD
jgi:hypothetical protein